MFPTIKLYRNIYCTLSNSPPLSGILFHLATVTDTQTFLMESHSFRPNTATDFTLSANSDWKGFPGGWHLGLKGCLGFMCNTQFLPLRGSPSRIPTKRAGAVTFYFNCQLLPHLVSTHIYQVILASCIRLLPTSLEGQFE